jgi:hypothetical protein
MSGLLELPGSNRYDALAYLLEAGSARPITCTCCICSLQLLAVARQSPLSARTSVQCGAHACQIADATSVMTLDWAWILLCAAGCTEETLKQVLYPLQLACASNMQVSNGETHSCTTSSRCWLMRARLSALTR